MTLTISTDGEREEIIVGSAADLEDVISRLTDLVGDDHPLARTAKSALGSVLADDDEFIAIDFTPLPL